MKKKYKIIEYRTKRLFQAIFCCSPETFVAENFFDYDVQLRLAEKPAVICFQASH